MLLLSYILQEAMENFVFPYENQTKLIKNVRIGKHFSYFD